MEVFMNKRYITVYLLFFFSLVCFVSIGGGTEAHADWWKAWNRYPNVPRITGPEIKAVLSAREPFVFVYAGYQIHTIVCGSLIIPYTFVPPYADGSRVKLTLPKDMWIFAY
jgi:hypothetical protein